MTVSEDPLESDSIQATPMTMKQAFQFLAEEIQALKLEVSELKDTVIQIQGSK